jgi:hypothetical protein
VGGGRGGGVVKMIYRREINCGVIGRISTVNSDTGEYPTETWISGTMTSQVKLNSYEMGWNSVDEFLKQRKGFVEVNDN